MSIDVALFDEGAATIFADGEPDVGFITSDNLPLEGGGGGDVDRDCVFSVDTRSVSCAGEGAVDVGERVAIGGSATDPDDNPAGRGWGGRTAGSCGLEGYEGCLDFSVGCRVSGE